MFKILNIQNIKKIIKGLMVAITVLCFGLTLLVLIVGTIAFVNRQPFTIFNHTFSVVPTDSMEPDIKVGDFVIGKKISYDQLEVGDDVIFYYQKDDIYIVHRIYMETSLGFITKGINNTAADDGYLTEENFVAIVVRSGNFLGLGKLVTSNRSMIFLVVAIIFITIIFKEGLNIFRIISDHKKENSPKLSSEEIDQIRLEIENKLKEEGVIKQDLDPVQDYDFVKYSDSD